MIKIYYNILTYKNTTVKIIIKYMIKRVILSKTKDNSIKDCVL